LIYGSSTHPSTGGLDSILAKRAIAAES
jgi:hypothetical protein